MRVGENLQNLHEWNSHTKAPLYSELLALLSQLKDTDLTDRVRTALELVYQELIDAEAAAMIGALPYERSGVSTIPEFWSFSTP